MKFKNDIDKRWKVYALAGCVCILFFVCLSNLGRILGVIGGFFRIMKPVILGFVIAYIINPIAVFFQRRLFAAVRREKLRWTLSTLLAIALVLLFIALILAMLIPQISANITSLADNYPYYIISLNSFLDNNSGALGNITVVQKLVDSISSEGGLISTVGELITGNAQVIIEKTTSIGSAALNWLIGMVFAIYFLLEKKNFASELARLFSLMLSPLRYERLRILLVKFNAIFSKYIVFELFDALIIGAVNYVFMSVMKMPDVMFVSVVVAVTNLIPTFGPIIGAAVGGFILLLLDPSTVIPFLIFALVLQTLDSYVIKPKLFGDALDVPGVLILIAVIIFGKLFGVVGMLLAIPFAAIIVYAYSEALIPWLALQKDLRAYRRDEDRKEKTGGDPSDDTSVD